MNTAQAKAQALEFGQERVLDAQLAMRAVLGRLEKEPFTGAHLAAGEVVREFRDAEDAATHFKGAIDAYLRGLGAEIREFSAPVDGTLPTEGWVEMAPFDQMVIAGVVPVTVADARAAVPYIVEACAELVRVILSTAVVAAAEDCGEDEHVVVFLRAVEFAGSMDFTTGEGRGIARVRASIYTSNEPRASYLLGNVAGREPRKPLAWTFPFVEHVYGPNRLRWRDLRSPDYEPEQPPKMVVPS